MPSKLHEMIKAHQGMTLAQKEDCTCPKCKGTSVDKFNRKVEVKLPSK
jgi:hypothetical protein